MRFRSDVKKALANHEAVVALETTLIAHGQKYPGNLEAAHGMENAVRSEGAVPATIGILKGEIVVGIDDADIEYYARNRSILKCSRRDLPIMLAKKLDGATTVCGTLVLAHQAGIKVFCSGGLGGVHRGHPFDVSADLQELARTPMIAISSGCKALLDIEATREMLETYGIPVIGYGTDEFPGFYARQSGFPVDVRVDTPEEVAAIARERDRLGLSSALLVTVPVPAEDELPMAEAEEAINRAVELADEQGLHGRDVTPFLLAKIGELTNGRSVRANSSLLLNNAHVAAKIALALTK